MSAVLTGAVGFAVGALIVWLALRSKADVTQSQLSSAQSDLDASRTSLNEQREANAALREQLAGLTRTLAHEKESNSEKLGLLTSAREQLKDTFQALAADALNSNNQSFLDLAKTKLADFQNQAQGDLDTRKNAVEALVAPIKESLSKVDEQLGVLEGQRREAYAGLKTQVESLIGTQGELREETSKLVRALRTPSVRGRWGEIQLRRVVEIAGMLPYCDFVEQESVTTDDGRLRPDLVVKLPGGKNVVVDAKTPLQAYLDAVEETDDEVRRAYMASHARQVRDHMTKLSSKSYSDQFQPSPDFVVMFLPGEAFFSAAVECDTTLLEEGMRSTNVKVIPASPTTLIALLRAVAYGWRQERLAHSAQEISNLGRELHERLRTFVGHLAQVKKGIDGAIEAYNKAARSLESRVLVSARRFPELGASATVDIPELDQVEATTLTLALDGDEEIISPKQQGVEIAAKDDEMLPLDDKASA